MNKSIRNSLTLALVSILALFSFVAASGQVRSAGADATLGPNTGKLAAVRNDGLAPKKKTPERFADYAIKAADIQKVPDPQLWRVLNYLLPEVFPRAEGAWHTRLQRYVFYVDSTQWEPEQVENLRPQDVQEVQVWDKRIGPTPMALPGLARTRFIVSIVTKEK